MAKKRHKEKFKKHITPAPYDPRLPGTEPFIPILGDPGQLLPMDGSAAEQEKKLRMLQNQDKLRVLQNQGRLRQIQRHPYYGGRPGLLEPYTRISIIPHPANDKAMLSSGRYTGRPGGRIHKPTIKKPKLLK